MSAGRERTRGRGFNGLEAIIAAEPNEIVPLHRTEALRRSSRDVVLDRVIAGVGHNDIYDRNEFNEAMREGLSFVEERNGAGANEP